MTNSNSPYGFIEPRQASQAHSTGGGMDINIFPQEASLNRGAFRRLEKLGTAAYEIQSGRREIGRKQGTLPTGGSVELGSFDPISIQLQARRARGTGAKYRRHQMTRDEWQQQAAVILREQHDIRPLDIRYAEWRNAYMLHGYDVEAGVEYMAKAWLNRQSAAARKHYRARPRA